MPRRARDDASSRPIASVDPLSGTGGQVFSIHFGPPGLTAQTEFTVFLQSSPLNFTRPSVYDAANRPIAQTNRPVTSQSSAGITTSTYDGSGNLLATLSPGNQWTTYTWDGENRLTQVAIPSGIVDLFTYNGDGQRVQKQDSTGTTRHVWDGQNILLETNAGNSIQVAYTVQPQLYGNVTSQSRGSGDSFCLFDQLGSARQLANTSSTVTDEYLYDSFGNRVLGGTSGVTANPFRYVGRLGYYLDADVAALYVRARHFAPAVGDSSRVTT